jgi:hypothetical protein
MKRLLAMLFGLLLCLSLVAHADGKPSLDLKPYGYIKLDGSYDQQLTSHGNFVMWVPQPDYEGNDEQFNMTANQTRLGLNLDGTGYGELAIKGVIEFDLYGSVSGASIDQNTPMLMLRHAYFSVGKSGASLLAGQTWDLISPLNPSTLNYPVLWGCGNIGYRRPQIRGSMTFEAGENATMNVAAGFFRTIGSDLTPTFSLAVGEASDGEDDGTDAGIPSVQGLWETRYSWDGESFVRAGVSGLWGQLKAETNQGNFEEYESWAAVGHLMISTSTGWGISGEYYTGINLGSYFGGILNNSTIEGVESNGGWASTWYKVSPKVKLTAGFGFDQVNEDQINTNSRQQNRAIFGNIAYSLAPKVTLGLEVSDWETKYKEADAQKNVRVQSSFILNF